MKAELTPERDLRISVSEEERLELEGLKEKASAPFDSDQFMYDYFEGFIANNEYEWTDPSAIGALTAAPILAILNEDGTVQEAFGFMDYQLYSVQERLLEYGTVLFTRG